MPQISALSKQPSLETFLWSRGVWLSSAPLAFATEAERAEHGRLSVGAAPTAILERIKMKFEQSPPRSDASTLERISQTLPYFAEELDKLRPRRELCDRLKKKIDDKLRAGALIALGHATRAPTTEPQIIDTSLIGSFVIQSGLRLSVCGLTFDNVRVLERVVAENLEAEWRAQFAAPTGPTASETPAAFQPPEQVQRGPKAHMSECARDAFWALLEEGAVDFTGSFRSHESLIRRKMQQMWPDAGYSDQRPSPTTLRREVAPLFREQIERRKKADSTPSREDAA